MKQVEKNIIKVYVSNEEEIILSKCDNDLDNEEDTTLNVAWTVYRKNGLAEKFKK